MKRRNFLKTTTMLGAGMVVAPNLLLAKDKKILFSAPIPKLLPGQLGVIYGKSGSGKSKVIYEMANVIIPETMPIYNSDALLIDLECNPDMRVFENLETIVRDYPRETVYIDNFNLLDGGIKTYHRLRDIQKIAMERKCRIWVTTLQQNRAANDDFFHLHNPDPTYGMPIMSMSACVIYVRNKNGHIYGDIIKNRYGDRGTIYFGIGRR